MPVAEHSHMPQVPTRNTTSAAGSRLDSQLTAVSTNSARVSKHSTVSVKDNKIFKMSYNQKGADADVCYSGK